MSENKLRVGKSENMFDYVEYDSTSIEIQKQFKIQVLSLFSSIELLGHSRYTSLAITDLEKTYMWIGKAIRESQIERNKETKLQEQRNNS